MRLLVLIVFGLYLAGCAQSPTKVYDQRPVKEVIKNEIAITEETIFIDARAPFDYTTSHFQGALPLRYEEMSQQEKPFLGLLDLDLFAITRRLARMGIAPDSQIVVVGKGLQGQGEEGRVAWTLRYLGIKNVRFASMEAFSMPLTTAEAPPLKPKAIWRPELDETLFVTSAEFLKGMVIPKTSSDAPFIVDVRPSEDYLGKSKGSLSKTVPDVGAINIPWKEFFDSQGFVNRSMKEKLNSVSVTSDRLIYVISDQGVESAAVTMALRELGFSRAGNVAGGYLELVSRAGKSKKGRK